MENSPDCTGIFRMKKTFSDFLSSPSHDSLSRTADKSDSLATTLRYDEPQSKRTRFSHMSSRSTTSLSMAKLIEKEQDDRLREADYIKAKSKVTSLETEIINLKTTKSKEMIALEQDLQQLKTDREFEIRDMDNLRTKLKYVSRCEEDTKSELSDERKTYSRQKHEFQQKLLSLQKEKFELQSDCQEREENLRQGLSKLRTEKCRSDAELQISESELEETRGRMDVLQKKVNELLITQNELETLKIEAMNAERKAGDLQRELDNYQDDTVVVKAMKVKITEHGDLERENRQLKEKISTLKDSRDNSMLKDEQILSLERQVKHLDTMRVELARVTQENETLTSLLDEWEQASNSKKPISNVGFSRQISELQSQVALMLAKQGQLQTSLNSTDRARQQAVDGLNSYKAQQPASTNLKVDVDDHTKRLKRRLLLLTKERDGYRKTLDSMEGDMTVNFTSSRVQVLEDTIRDYGLHIEALETQIRKKTEENQLLAQKCNQATSTVVTSSVEDKATIDRLKARVDELELYLEHRNLKGDYDPTKTKVLHLRLNPASQAQQEKVNEVPRLREENDKLRQAIKVLEERYGGASTPGTALLPDIETMEASDDQEVKELKSHLQSAELKTKRLMEMFTKTSREYKEVVYMLTGYKVTISNHNVKVMSMYSESPEDFLNFQYMNNTLNLLENEYTASLSELMQQYLLQHGSIPAFMAALTMSLFSRQTIMIQ